MNIRYVVTLSEIERAELEALGAGGKDRARKFKHAQVLLAANAGSADKDIAAIVRVGTATVYRSSILLKVA